jgi:ACS family hexuronate transporter-like MFS transporter
MVEQSNTGDLSQPDSSYRWLILSVLTVTQIGASIAALSFGPLAPFFQETLNMTRAQVGLCTSFLYLGCILVAIPSGRLADRIGVRLVLFIGPAMMALFFLVISRTTSHLMLWVMALCAGIGYGVINPSTTKAIICWFSAKGRATAFGIKQSGVTAGAAIAAVMLPALCLWLGMQTAIFIMGIIVMVLAVFCYILNRDFPESTGTVDGKQGKDRSIRHVITNRNIILLSLANLLYSSLQLSLSTYLVLYLKEKLLIPVVMAGVYLAVAQICAGGGRVVWGLVSDHLFGGERKIVLVIIGIITTGTTLVMTVLTVTTPGWILWATIGLIGLSVLGRHGVSMIFVAELGGKALAGTAAGVFATIAYLGIIVGPPVFGYIVDKTGSYSLAWFVFAIASALATGILLLVRTDPGMEE